MIRLGRIGWALESEAFCGRLDAEDGMTRKGTVFISSRMDETGTSRKAAFEAVVESGFVPLMFEAMPALSLQVDSDQIVKVSSGDARKRLRARRREERLEIDKLIRSADCFIGIYANSMGDPEPTLCGQPPIVYELLRFLVQTEMRRRSIPQHRIDRRLGLLFPLPPDDYKFQITDNTRLEKEEERIWSQLEDLGKAELACEQEMEDYERRRVKERVELPAPVRRVLDRKENGYARAFFFHAKLFAKIVNGDVPMSSRMARLIKRKPHNEYGSFRQERLDVKGALPAYFPAPVLLHRLVGKWLRWIESTPLMGGNKRSPRSRTRVSIEIVGTDPKSGGYLLSMCQPIFVEGFDIRGVRLGKLSSGKRAISCLVEPYYDWVGGKSFAKRVEALDRRLGGQFSDLKVELSTSTRSEVSYCEPDGGAHYYDTVVDEDHPSEGSHFRMTVTQNDIPGMLYRVVERIAFHKGSIVGYSIGPEAPRNPGNQQRPPNDDLIHPERIEIFLVLWFSQLKVNDVIPTIRLMEAELRFLPGIYAVQTKPWSRRLLGKAVI
jgi:hypothetical protein